jgi:hypothetical protein
MRGRHALRRWPETLASGPSRPGIAIGLDSVPSHRDDCARTHSLESDIYLLRWIYLKHSICTALGTGSTLPATQHGPNPFTIAVELLPRTISCMIQKPSCLPCTVQSPWPRPSPVFSHLRARAQCMSVDANAVHCKAHTLQSSQQVSRSAPSGASGHICVVTLLCYPWLLKMTWHTSGCCGR